MSCAERLELANRYSTGTVQTHVCIYEWKEGWFFRFGLTYRAIPEGTLRLIEPTVQSSNHDSVTPSSEPVVGWTRVAHGDSLRISISMLDIDWGWVGKPEMVI
jgi:hypothetical protein